MIDLAGLAFRTGAAICKAEGMQLSCLGLSTNQRLARSRCLFLSHVDVRADKHTFAGSGDFDCQTVCGRQGLSEVQRAIARLPISDRTTTTPSDNEINPEPWIRSGSIYRQVPVDREAIARVP